MPLPPLLPPQCLPTPSKAALRPPHLVLESAAAGGLATALHAGAAAGAAGKHAGSDAGPQPRQECRLASKFAGSCMPGTAAHGGWESMFVSTPATPSACMHKASAASAFLQAHTNTWRAWQRGISATASPSPGALAHQSEIASCPRPRAPCRPSHLPPLLPPALPSRCTAAAAATAGAAGAPAGRPGRERQAVANKNQLEKRPGRSSITLGGGEATPTQAHTAATAATAATHPLQGILHLGVVAGLIELGGHDLGKQHLEQVGRHEQGEAAQHLQHVVVPLQKRRVQV